MADNTSTRHTVKEDINVQQWMPLKIDGKQYLLKSFFHTCETSYEIVLYDDLSTVLWHEIVDVDQFQEKWKEHNPNVESNLTNLLAHVKNSLEECREVSNRLETFGESPNMKIIFESIEAIKLVVRTKLKGRIPFTWTFVCSKCDQSVAKSMLMNPLFIMIKELCRQQQQLFSIIEKKDREIEDYKDQGYATSRNHLTTVPFRRTSFLSRYIKDEEFFENCNAGSSETLTLPDVTQLYRNVMVNKQIHRNKEAPLSTQSIPSLPTFDTVGTHSTNNEHANNNEIGESLPIASVPSLLMATKDEEKARREEIRQRLEEDERRNKKKKRKIKI